MIYQVEMKANGKSVKMTFEAENNNEAIRFVRDLADDNNVIIRPILPS